MKKKEKIENLLGFLVSFYDTLKLYETDSLLMDDETLSQMFFRKMESYGIDLNKELGWDHLKPNTKEDIYKLINSRK